MKLEINPSPKLTISVERQRQIVTGINRALELNPRQSFCLTGQPGSGKTFIMKALRDAVTSNASTKAFVGDVITLAEWHSINHANVMGKGPDTVLESAQTIRKLESLNKQAARENDTRRMHAGSKGVDLLKQYSLHIFLDELDSQPSTTEFTQSNWQAFANRVYEHTGRKRTGNQSDFVQFVCAMNRSMEEFRQNTNTHTYRRVLEMCVIVDFDKATVTAPAEPVTPVAPLPADQEIDALIMGGV
jgi:ABC-type dipeptide/oligopeptide/nickel transport system ATPase component